ncbi:MULTISPECIES: PKD domain-containing protein [Chitinophagaceae]
MNRLFKLLTLSVSLLLAVLAVQNAKGQTPTFSMTIANTSVTAACAGMGVTFTNTSAVATANLKWDFGDSYSATQINSIPHAYNNGGTYTVRLTNTATQEFVEHSIIIYNNPTAGFTLSDSSVCVGTNITFTSTSTPGDGALTSYIWSFGDGNVSEQSSSPTTVYAYNQGNVFAPILTVKDNNGCSGTSIQNSKIKITGSQIQTSFLANGSNYFSCDNTIKLENTTNEAGMSDVTYAWNFGDGSTSSEKAPDPHTYTNPGVYTITLQTNANGLSGCIPKFTKTVYIGQPTITIAIPGTVCQNSKIPLNVSANINGFISSPQDVKWTASNSTISSDGSSIVFGSAGTATLTAQNKNGCPTTAKLNINVLSNPVLTLNINPPSGICVGINTEATVNSTNGIDLQKYVWEPEGQNGSVHETSTSNQYTYKFTTAGQYNYQVTATSTDGCTATQTIPVSVAQECIDNGNGSAYNPIFSFQSVSCNDKYIIVIQNKSTPKTVDYWEVGGQKYPASNGKATISLSPATKGTIYSVNTYYTDGTNDLNRKITIIDEVASFDVTNSVNSNGKLYCANNSFRFSTNTINKDNIARYSWTITDLNNNTVLLQTNDMTSQFNYTFTTAGKYKIDLTITDITTNACTSSTSQTIEVFGFGGDFQGDNLTFCAVPAQVTFQSTIKPGQSPIVSQRWGFGDNTDTTINSSTPSTLAHIYDGVTGNYKTFTVTLRITDAMGCFVNIQKGSYVKIYQPAINFSSADTLLCKTRKVTFKNLSSAYGAQYTWTLGGETQTTSSSGTVSFTMPSNIPDSSDWTVSLHIVDAGGCTKDTTFMNYIRFRKPIADYTISNMDVFTTCPPFTLTVKNTSHNYDSVHWTINDAFSSIQKDSFYYTVLHPGPIALHLDAILDGCTDSIKQNYQVIGPVAKLVTKDTIGCTPYTSLLYLSDTTDIVSYQWNSGDGQTYTDKTSDSMRFTYNTGGVYYPSVTFVGREGCSDNQEYPSPIVVDQSVNLQYKDNYTFCLNDTLLKLTVSADTAIKYSWSQNPTTGYMSDSLGTTIGVRPTENTTYHVVAQSGNSCPSDSADIFVKTLEASVVTISPNTITAPAGTVLNINSDITITNENLVSQYYWAPDYQIDNRYKKDAHIVIDKDTAYLFMVRNSNGCISTDSLHIHALCNTSKLFMANAFTPNGDGKNDRFYVTGYGVKNVRHFIIVDRWGKKVFERNDISANDFNQGWDGTINGTQAAPGTYIYMAEIECTEGNIIPLKGSVVLIR